MRAFLPWAVFGTVLLAALPIAIDHTPQQVLDGLGPWYGVIKWVVIALGGVSILRATFLLGARNASRSKSAGSADKALVDRNGRTIDDLKYEAREIHDLVMSQSNDQVSRTLTRMRLFERAHPAWRDESPHRARTNFLEAARKAVDLRYSMNSNAAYAIPGDFKPADRITWGVIMDEELTKLTNALDEVL